MKRSQVGNIYVLFTYLFISRLELSLELKSDTVAVLAVLPRYPRYYRGNGYNFYSITAVLGPRCAGLPWGWGPVCGTTAAMGLSFSHVHKN